MQFFGLELPKYYGWRMVAAACALQAVQAMLLHNAFGAYIAVLEREFGWSKTALSGAAAVMPMEAALLGPLLGYLIDRFGPQGLIRIGVVMFGLGFCYLSTIDSLPGFYSAVIVIALGSSLCGYFPLNVSVIRWFEKYRARALSYVTLGLAIGGLFVPIVAASMQHFGWRVTALSSGVFAIVLGWPLSGLFKGQPSDIGEHVDGVAPGQRTPEHGGLASREHFSALEALRTPAFWLISLGHGFALLVVYAVQVHAISHIKSSLGYTVTQASFFIMLTTMSQMAGVGIVSVSGDKFEKRLLAAGCMVFHMVGLLLLAYASGPLMLGAFAIIHGVAWGMRGPMMQAIRADYFGSKSIGMIMGISSLVIVIGQAGGPLIVATLADWTGSFAPGLTMLAGLVGAGSLFFYFARRPRAMRS